MNRLLKRWLTVLFCTAVLLSILPWAVSAFGGENAESVMEYGTLEFVREVNPLYEGAAAEEEFEEPLLLLAADDEPALSEYLSFEKSAAALRTAMKERQKTINIHVHLVSPTSSEIKNLLASVFSEAVAHTGVPTEGDYLRWQWGTRSMSGSYRYAGRNYYFDLTYKLTYYTTAEEEAALDTLADELLAEILPEKVSDYETVRTIYEWICTNIRYDHDHVKDTSYKKMYTAYAALTDRTCVCQGYALLLYRLLLENGIDCRLIPGDANGPHAWNIVRLEGLYYNLDATWDSGKTPEELAWFLLGSESFRSHERYNNKSIGYYDSDEFHADYPMSEGNYIPPDPDVDRDGFVTSADALYLLRHTILPDRYPLAAKADFDGDGEITSQDVVYLQNCIVRSQAQPIP